jgi:hypothetical protein
VGPAGSTGPTGATGLGPSLQSLVFTAQDMNHGSDATPDVTDTLSTTGPIAIRSWRLAQSGPSANNAYNTVFNVPHDFVNSATQTLVIAHFYTHRSIPLETGSVVLQLMTQFTPLAGTILPPITTYTAIIASVTSSPSATSFNHYEAVFTLSEPITADDFALLSVSRVGRSASDTYPHSVFLTSVEFRYTTV